MDITAKKLHITVIFDPHGIGTETGPFSYRGEGGEPEKDFTARVDKEIGLVILHLHTEGVEQAMFATHPVQWLSSMMTPVSTPAGLSLSRDSDDKVTIVDINSVVVGQIDFPFEISVMYQGKTYTSSEPTIINTPIIGGSMLAAETRAASEIFIS
jgi:hypothetical protein